MVLLHQLRGEDSPIKLDLDTASWIGKFSNNSSLERPRIGPLARDRKEWRAKEIYIQQRVLISR